MVPEMRCQARIVEPLDRAALFMPAKRCNRWLSRIALDEPPARCERPWAPETRRRQRDEPCPLTRHLKRTAARGGVVHGRPASGAGGRRFRQDARAHVPHRAHPRAGSGVRRGDSPSRSPTRRRPRCASVWQSLGTRSRGMGVHLPLHVRPYSPGRCRAAGLHEELHHLRHGRFESSLSKDIMSESTWIQSAGRKNADEPYL